MNRQNSGPQETVDQRMEYIRHATRKDFSTEYRIRIALSGLRGEFAIAELCRRGEITQSLDYS